MVNNKIALITGGSRGIGNGIARRLSDSGVQVILIGRDESTLRQQVSEINSTHENASYLKLDFDEPNSIDCIADFLKFNDIRPSILIHGLGGGFGSKTQDEIETYKRVMDLNFMVAVELSNLLLEGMIEQKWGRIVFIGTLAINHLSAEAPYICAKSALMTYMKILSKKAAEREENVIVTSVSPGAISVPGKYLNKIEAENPKLLENFLSSNKIAAKRLGKISEVANVVDFLCSDLATYLHGANIEIDGGASN